MISFRRRSSALHTARLCQFGISELRSRPPREARPPLRHPSWEAHVGKTSLGIWSANFSSKQHSLAGRRTQANAVAYFIGRMESKVQPSLQLGKMNLGLFSLAAYLARALSALVRSIYASLEPPREGGQVKGFGVGFRSLANAEHDRVVFVNFRNPLSVCPSKCGADHQRNSRRELP